MFPDDDLLHVGLEIHSNPGLVVKKLSLRAQRSNLVAMTCVMFIIHLEKRLLWRQY